MAKKLKPRVRHFIGYSALLVASLFVLASLVSHTPAPLHPAASEPDAGRIQVKVPIDHAEYIILNNETNELVKRHVGGTEIFTLPADTYRVEFAPVTGHITPDPMTFNLPAGATMEINGDYEFTCQGPLLGVKVFPEYGRYAIYNTQGKKMIETEGSQFFTYPAGQYWIEFSELPDYKHPPRQAFRLFNKIVTTINAIYDKK